MALNFTLSPALMPEDIVVVQATDSMWLAPAQPEEERYIRGAVEKRKREFRAGRNAAREALAKLGFKGNPVIRKDQRRRPLWPAGTVGSITHTDGLCIAVAALGERYQGVGIDAERSTALSEGLRAKICTVDELAWAGAQSRQTHIDWHKVLFCTKEAVFKLLNPVYCQEMAFRDINVSPVGPGSCSFSARVSASRFPKSIDIIGRYHITNEYIVCATWLIRQHTGAQAQSAHEV